MNWGTFCEEGWLARHGYFLCGGMAWQRACLWMDKDVYVCDQQTMASNLLDSFIALLYIKAINL